MRIKRMVAGAGSDIFSKRQRRLRGDFPDVYTYEDLPNPLRVQIVQLWFDAFGGPEEDRYGSIWNSWEYIVATLRREYGVFRLPGSVSKGRRDYLEELSNFFLKEESVEKAVDAVELSFQVIEGWARRRYIAPKTADGLIRELNGRFKEHGVGYQFESGEIVRLDSEYMHAEVVKPALRLLNRKSYRGPQDEFLRAHEHYRAKRYKETLNECLKSLESLMKAICDKRKWEYSRGATAKRLIEICWEKGLIPDYWKSSFSSLRSLLESSVPTGRNRLSGHGQGPNPTPIPGYLAAYMLHMTAATIVFLAEAEEALG